MDDKIVADIKANGSRLLIADDERVVRNHLREVGSELGFDVYTAADGLEAWDTFNAIWPEISILDIYMPGMNGLKLMGKIKEANEVCKVVLITGYSHYKQLVYKQNFEPDGIITKPFSSEKIKREILNQIQGTGILV